MTTLVKHLISWPIAVMLAINLSRTVVNTRWAKWGRLTLLLALLAVVWMTTGCGGGQTMAAAPAATDLKKPSKPPKLPDLPKSWTATDLVPLPGFNAAQASAVNISGVVVGHSENPDLTVEATMWANGQVIDLGPGVATAINDTGYVVGYSADSTGMFFTAHLWFNGSESDIGTDWLPVGINNHNLVVGPPLNYGPAQQWDAINGQRDIPGCPFALAVNDSGTIVGADYTSQATVCGMPSFGVQGAAGAINTSGVAVGYQNPDAATSIATEWLPGAVAIAQQGLATGINDYGWVVGETFNGGTGNVVAMARSRMAGSSRIRLVTRISGQAQPFIWTQTQGLIALPAPLVTAEDIRGNRVVGTGITPAGDIHGYLLEGK